MITENKFDENNHRVDDGTTNLSKNDTSFGDPYAHDNEPFSDNHHDQKNSLNLENPRLPTIIPSYLTSMSIFMELPFKIMNGVSDLFNFQSGSPDSEIPAKRPYSPRPHHHAKQTPIDIARGRGRGRGRSQLRRSGVSQTRHRQERIRQGLSADIQDDLNGLREFEDSKSLEDEVPSTPCVDDNGMRIRYGADGAETDTSSSKFPFFFGYCDMKRRKIKGSKNTKGDRRSITNNCKVRYIPECPIDIVGCKLTEDREDLETDSRVNRKRLQSDRSVDSEDSYCIVFETGSESDYETDYDYNTTDDDDDDDNADRGNKSKVRFSPHPKIHTMITWDYAYRAARRGPWEEMARDRERFKYRINCIAQVLDPVLVPQHRSEIWQHRFAVEI